MNQVIPLAVMLDTVELNGIQTNWRTDELGALNERLAAFGTMRVRHLRGRYQKIGTLQISEKCSRSIKFGPPKKLKTVEEYYLRKDGVQLEHPTDRCVYFLGAPEEFMAVETLYHVQARLAPAPVIPLPVPVVPVIVPAVLPFL